MNTHRSHVSGVFWQAMGWPFRLLMVLVLLGNAVWMPAAGLVQAATPVCSTSGPNSGAYSVLLCFSSPADGASLAGNQTVSTTISVTGATPPTPGGKLFFYLDGEYILTDYQSPYTFVLSTPRWVDGLHTLEVEAQLRDGFLTERASLSLTFTNGVTVPPVNTNTRGSVSGTTPPAGQSFVVAAVGDGAGGETNATSVTDLISSWNPNLLLYLGDVYEKGTPTEFSNWYGNGSTFYSRFRDITNPTIGNHEYEANVAPGYFDYWDNISHYYSYNVAGWHFISLDSTTQFGQMSVGSAQYQWLANDLANNTAACTVAYWHHPRFNVGPQGDSNQMQAIWALLAQNGVDLVLTGHDHNYQRWTPLDANGIPSANGITQFVVGTGGHAIQGFVRSDTRLLTGFDTSLSAYGAMRLELNQSGAAFRFVNKDGVVLDSGSVPCSGAPADTTAPGTPTNLAASANSSTRVDLTWTAATDDVGVTGYDIYRNGSLLTSVGPEPKYSDNNVSVGASYVYEVKARDAAGHVSGSSNTAPVTTASVIFADGFESGDFSNWDSGSTLTTQQTDVFNGAWAASATTTQASDPAKSAKKTLSPAMTDVYYRAWFKLNSHGSNSTDILRFRTSSNTAILSILITSANRLALRNDLTSVTTTDSTTPFSLGNWHSLQAHVVVNGSSSQVEVWLDGIRNSTLSQVQNLSGITSVGAVQLGEPQLNRIYDLVLDDAAIDSQFIPTADSPPTTPTNLQVTSNTGGHVNLSWTGVSDLDLAGYEIYRNSAPLVSLGNVTTYSDTAISSSTSYQYQVRSRDTGGNLSGLSNMVSVTTPVDSVSPSVTLLDPGAGSLLRGSVTLSADASDNIAISHVSFLVNGIEVGDSDEAPYSLTWDSSTVPDGPATVAAQAVDTAGNLATTPSVSVTIDNTFPDTVISSGPSGTVASITAIFEFTSTESGSTFTCSLDGAAFSSCASPKTYNNLADGAHHFQVAAADSAGNADTTPASQDWTVDTSTLVLLNDGFETGSLSPTWVNQGGGLSIVQQPVLEGAYATRATSTGNAVNWAYATVNPTRNNVYYRTWFNIVSQGANNVNLLRFRSSTNGAILGVFVSSTGKLGMTNDTPGGASTTSTINVSRGAWHELQVHVNIDTVTGGNGQVEVWFDGVQVAALSKTDNLGTNPVGRLQLGESQTGRTYDVLFDEVVARTSLIASPTTPFTILDSGPSGLVNTSLAGFTFSSNAGGASFECALDGVPFNSCTSPQDYPALTDGTHTFQVRAIDANTITDPTPATRTWTIDTTAPTVTSTNPVDGASSVDVAASASAVFSESVDPVTVTSGNFTLVDQGSQATVSASISYDPATKTITLTPVSYLADNVTYTATLKGGPGGIADPAGNPLAADAVWSFATNVLDVTPPTPPSGLSATPISSGQVDLSWNAATDNVGVIAYDIYRDGVLLAIAGNVTSYSDNTAAPSTSYTYEVKARDMVGNVSDPSNQAAATTPAALFVDRFETGDLSRWSSVSNLAIQRQDVFAGAYAARSSSVAGPASFAYKNLGVSQYDVYTRLQFNILSQGANSIHLLRFRTATGTALLQPFVSSTGKLGYRNDTNAAQVTSTLNVSSNAWHELQVHVYVNGSASLTEFWLDGTKVNDLTRTESLGLLPVGRIQLGDDTVGATYNVVYDDITVAGAFINSGDSTAPDAPTGLSATPISETRIDLVWNASADNVGVTGYHIFRDGSLLTSIGTATTYSDTAVAVASPHQYEVRARDAAENVSPASNTATAASLSDTTNPTVTLTAPAEGATISGSLTLTANATDNIAVDHVDFLVNGSVIATDLTSPYSTSWSSTSAADGTATITAQAVDLYGNSAADSHTISIDNAAPDTTIDSGPSGYVTISSATFTFSSSEPGTVFECSLDFVPYSSCTSPLSYASIADGIHDLQVRAIDAAGNVDSTPASRVWTIDTTLPTVLDAGISPLNGAVDVPITTSVTAVFSEDMNPASITTGTFFITVRHSTTPIPATVSYNAATRTATLVPAVSLDYLTAYTATVVGGVSGTADLAGNTMAADRVWSFTTVTDTIPPSVTLTAPANGSALRGTVTLTANASDNVAIDHVDFLVNGSVVGTVSTAPYSFNWNTATLADGSVTITARAVDIFSNSTVSTANTFTLDNTAPTVTSTTPASGATGVAVTTSVSAIFSEAMDAATLTTSNVFLTRQGNTTIPATVSYNAATRTVTLVPAASLDFLTSYTVTVRGGAGGVTDQVGNPLAVNRTWSFTTQADTVAPETTISAGPASATNSTTATFSFTSSEANSTFDCSLDGAAFKNCTSPKSYTRLADGAHNFRVRATDASGNMDATPAAWNWTIDSVVPTVSNVSPASGATGVAIATSASAVFSESMDPATITAATFTLVRQGTTTPVAATVSYNSSTRAVTLQPSGSLLASTTYTATIKSGASGVKDLAGNPLAADYVWSFTTAGSDTTPPDTTITAGPSGATNSTSASFSFTSTEAGSTFGCSLDGAAFTACTSPINYSALSNGSHTFQVRATDAAGNTDATPASRTWTIDRTAPTVSLTSPANGATVTGNVGITATASDNTAVAQVSFYVDGQLLITDTSSPYSANWNTNKVTKTTHTIYAVAVDTAGNSTQSATITVTVR